MTSQDIVFEVAKWLRPQAPHGDAHESFFFDFPGQDIISLASVCKKFRQILYPQLFVKIVLGEQQRSPNYAVKLHLLLSNTKLLHQVQYVLMFDLDSKGIKKAAECLRAMKNLKGYRHESLYPLPTRFADVFSTLPSFEILFIGLFGTDSLPLLHNFKNLQSLSISVKRPRSVLGDVLKLAPTTIPCQQGKRYIRSTYFERYLIPTQEENHRALINEGLASVLAASKNTLVELKFDGVEDEGFLKGLISIGLDTHPQALGSTIARAQPIFNVPGFRKLLESPNLTHICVPLSFIGRCTLLELSFPLKALKSFHVFTDLDNSTYTPFVRSICKDGPLEDLELLNLPCDDLKEVFAPGFNSNNISQLTLRIIESETDLDCFRIVLESCPKLEVLDFQTTTPTFKMSDIIRLLEENCPNLRKLSMNAKWEGRAPGHGEKKTFNGFRANIDAHKPLYLNRFRDLAKRCPDLEFISWRPEPTILWLWKFKKYCVGIGKVTEEAINLAQNPCGFPHMMM
ncbi:hypothetical protein T439DRAFT_381732 [Meredithblackwellia eburnea MCA 4105]